MRRHCIACGGKGEGWSVQWLTCARGWALPGQATAGSLQSLCWASAAVGGVASSYFSGSLVQAWGPRGVFALTAAFPLVVSAAATLIDEAPAPGLKLRADRDSLRAHAPPAAYVGFHECLTFA